MKQNMIFLTVIILTLCCSFCSYSKKISIYLREYNYSFTPQKEGCVDTLSKKLEDGRELKIFLFDCKGKMHIECYKNKNKIEEGDYISSLDLLKKYITTVNGISGGEKIGVYEFYEPLRSGSWIFYDNKGKLLFKKIYKEGIVQNK